MAALLLLLIIPISIILKGFALSWLWVWFVVPLGVPVIGIAQAVGIAAILNYMTAQDVQSPQRETAEVIAIAVVAPLFILFFGWIIHLFM